MNQLIIHRKATQLRSTVVAALLVSVAAPALAQPDPPSRVVVFGASYSDVGNIYETYGAPPSPPYSGGRWCNGPLWHEVAGSALGWPEAVPSLLGGHVYAYGGAQTGQWMWSPLNCPDVQIPTFGWQIEIFLSSNDVEATDLFIISIPGNDMLNYLFQFGNNGNPPADAVANVVAHVERLAAEGAQSFIVLNMPPIGIAPLLADAGLSIQANQYAIDYNTLLGPALEDAADTLNVTIHLFDCHEVFSRVLADPGSFGFTDVTNRALTGGVVDCNTVYDGIPVSDADRYLWWDTLHPTRAMQAIIGQALVDDLLSPPGDLNCDGAIDAFDIEPFITAVFDPDGYAQQYPACDRMLADMNGDGVVDSFDIEPFIDCLFGGNCR